MLKKLKLIYLPGILGFLFFISQSIAWNNTNGVLLCSSTKQENVQAIVSDDKGGAYVLWLADSCANTSQLCAQHLDKNGIKLWAENGIPVALSTCRLWNASMMSDGSGGAFITWQNFDYSFNLQHLNSSGISLLGSTGSTMFHAYVRNSYTKMVSDDMGGYYMMVTLSNSDNSNYIYVIRMSDKGQFIWSPHSVLLNSSKPAIPGYYFQMIKDNNGGVIVSWLDNIYPNRGVYAQHINSQGSTMWGNNGISIHTTAGTLYDIGMAENGEGGAFITWEESQYMRESSKIYVQQIDNHGALQWNSDGICVGMDKYWIQLKIVSDTTGNAFIAWCNETGQNYIQSITSNGIARWDPSGILVCKDRVSIDNCNILPDNNGGAFIATNTNYSPILQVMPLQHINGFGQRMWGDNGINISSLEYKQHNTILIPDGSGGIIAAWEGFPYHPGNSDVKYNIYTQQLFAGGNTTNCPLFLEE